MKIVLKLLPHLSAAAIGIGAFSLFSLMSSGRSSHDIAHESAYVSGGLGDQCQWVALSEKGRCFAIDDIRPPTKLSLARKTASNIVSNELESAKCSQFMRLTVTPDGAKGIGNVVFKGEALEVESWVCPVAIENIGGSYDG